MVLAKMQIPNGFPPRPEIGILELCCKDPNPAVLTTIFFRGNFDAGVVQT